jgi:hypothetical protein
MQLRNHPFMSVNGISIWPPPWIWTDGGANTHPAGEIGILERMQRSTVDPNACFLRMSHDGSTYVGRLRFDHQGFCQQFCELLAAHRGRSLKEIAELDIP